MPKTWAKGGTGNTSLHLLAGAGAPIVELWREIESAVEYSPALAWAVAGHINARSRRDLGCDPGPSAFETLFRQAEAIYPGFMYLIWRETDGRHHCSLALDENDLDRHSWKGQGATPALALASALVISLGDPEVPARTRRPCEAGL